MVKAWFFYISLLSQTGAVLRLKALLLSGQWRGRSPVSDGSACSVGGLNPRDFPLCPSPPERKKEEWKTFHGIGSEFQCLGSIVEKADPCGQNGPVGLRPQSFPSQLECVTEPYLPQMLPQMWNWSGGTAIGFGFHLQRSVGVLKIIAGCMMSPFTDKRWSGFLTSSCLYLWLRIQGRDKRKHSVGSLGLFRTVGVSGIGFGSR